MTRSLIAAFALGLLAAACAPQDSQRAAIDPRLQSGVSSSNGGGQRTTNGLTGVVIGPTGTVQGRAPNGPGNAY